MATKTHKSKRPAKKLAAAKKLQKTRTLTTLSDFTIGKSADAASPKLF